MYIKAMKNFYKEKRKFVFGRALKLPGEEKFLYEKLDVIRRKKRRKFLG